MGSLSGLGCIRVIRRRRRSVKRLHRSFIAAVSVSVLSDGLRPIRSAHGRFRSGGLCPNAIAPQMAFPSQRLFLVFSFNPCPNAALCIDRIDHGFHTKKITALWSRVWPEYLVPRISCPAGRRVLAAANLTPQDFVQ